MAYQKLVRLSLWLGIAIPVLYFGIQLIAVAFHPGYSFASMDASELGSDGSTFPSLFNVAAIAQGLAAIFVVWGFFSELRRHGKRLLSYVVAIGLLCMAVSMINAGLFPLPHPLHTSGVLAAIGMGMLILPLAIPTAIWNLNQSHSVKFYFFLNFIMMILMSLIVSGFVQRVSVWAGTEIPGFQHFLNNYSGVLQRISAVIIFIPVAACAIVLLREHQASNSAEKA